MSTNTTPEAEPTDKRVWVAPSQRDWINDHKEGSENQSDVISHLISLHDALEAIAGDVPRNPTPEDLRDAAGTPRSGSGTEAVDTDALADALAERLEGRTIHPETLADSLEQRLDTGGSAMNSDDVKAAVERGVENALERGR